MMAKKSRGARKPETVEALRAYNRKYQKQRRADAIARGYCSMCGSEKAVDGFRLGPDCRARERKRARDRQAAAKKKHLCSRCRKAKPTPGYATCKTCREEQ